MKSYYVDDERFWWLGNECKALPTVEDETIRFVVEKTGEEFVLSNCEFNRLCESREIQLIPKKIYRADDQPNALYDRLSDKAKIYEYARYVRLECVNAILKLDPSSSCEEKNEVGNNVYRREYKKDPVKFEACFGRSLEVSYRTLKRWVKAFIESCGSPNSQLPKHFQKGNRSHKYTDAIDIAPYIEWAINKVQKDPKKWKIQAVCDTIENEINKDNDELPPSHRIKPPSYDVVYREVNALTEYERVLFDEGPDAPRVRFRRSLKRNRDLTALAVVEVDHTTIDLILVDEEGQAVGRPTLTTLICRNTKVLLGYYLGFEPASFRTVSMALRMALKKKKKPAGAKNDWPMCGIPVLLVVDNGPEFHSHHLEHIARTLGFLIKFCPRKTAWYKGTVERWYGTANTRLFHRLPGTTLSCVLDLGDYKPEKNACLTLEQLREIFEVWVCDEYHQSRHRSIRTSPAHMWQERQKSDHCRLVPEDRVDELIGETATKPLTRTGLSGPPGLGLQYASNELSVLFEEVGNREVEFRYNSLDLGRIYVFHPITGEIIPADCTYGDYADGLSEQRHKLIVKRLKERAIHATPEALSEARRTIDRLVEDAKSGLQKKRRARAKEQSDRKKKNEKSKSRVATKRSTPSELVPFFGDNLEVPEIEIMSKSGEVQKL